METTDEKHDLVFFAYELSCLDEPLLCWLAYEPAEDGYGDHPDYPSYMTLVNAYLYGMDIADKLSTYVTDKIEDEAREKYETTHWSDDGQSREDDE